VVAECACGVVLMHMQGTPRTMQQAPYYSDVTKDVVQFLAQRVQFAQRQGIHKDRIAVDPGFGFGKTDAHNFTLLSELSELGRMHVPLVVGLSRKGTLGRVSGRAVGDRASASVAAALLAAERGADVVRVHDVAATRDALSVLQAMRDATR
jgi:dihydropteroate synthase